MAISKETLRAARELRVAVSSIADDRTRALVRAWVRAWDETASSVLAGIDDALAESEAGRWPSRQQILRTHRLMRGLEVALAQLQTLAAEAGVTISGDAGSAARLGADAQPSLIASQLPEQAGVTAELAARFDRLDPAALQGIVERTAQQVTALHYPLAPAAYEAMLRELIRGVAVGDNPRTAAQRMLARVESRFNGGLTRALTIARTEILDAHRAAARAAQAANQDVLAGWVWHCQLDARACPSCWARHGSQHPLDEPGPLDHQQGRCARTPQTKTWRQLGFQINEPPSVMPDAQTAFRAMPRADQLAVMGPARLAALDAGRAQWGDLSMRRQTHGWRDSYIPRPARQFAA